MGLAGMVAAKLCKAKVILTDYDEAALSLLQSNVIKNFKDDGLNQFISNAF